MCFTFLAIMIGHCTRYAAVHKPALMYEIIQSIGKKWQDFMSKIELRMENLTGEDHLCIEERLI
jgi:hypothetical protein